MGREVVLAMRYVAKAILTGGCSTIVEQVWRPYVEKAHPE